MPIEDIDSELRQVAESLVLADLTYRKGKIAEAEPMYERSLAMLLRTYDEAHPDVDACLLRLGDIYFSRDKLAQALSTYSRLHGVRSRVLSNHHLDTVAVSFKIAKSQEKLNRVDEAARTYEEAISLGEQWLPPGHPLVGSMMESFAILLRKAKNDPQRATEIEQHAKEYRKKYKGPKITAFNLPLSSSAPSTVPITPSTPPPVRAQTANHLRDTGTLDTGTLEPDVEKIEPRKRSSTSPLLIAFIVLVAIVVPTLIGLTMMRQRVQPQVLQAPQPSSFGATTLPAMPTNQPAMPTNQTVPVQPEPVTTEPSGGTVGTRPPEPVAEPVPVPVPVPRSSTLVRTHQSLPQKPILRRSADKPVRHVKPKPAATNAAPLPVTGVWSDIYRAREKYTH